MKKGYLKKKTEELKMAKQDQSFRTRWVKYFVDRITDFPKCRICRKIKIRHDKVAALKHWQ